MPNPTIVSLALLKVNWDLLKKDYLENFVPLVTESIRCLGTEVVSLPEVQAELQSRFGLYIPQNAIKALLSRVRKKGYIRQENRVFYANHDALAGTEFRQTQGNVVRMYEALISSLVQYCAEQHNVRWSTEEADAALNGYLEEHQVELANSFTGRRSLPVPDHPRRSSLYLVGSFVNRLQETASGDFEFLETIVKGSMLANAIFLPDPTQATRKFHKTEVFFDTSFLIYALGYGGVHRQRPCRELLDLLYETGADLRCFEHTLEETRGVLIACSQRIAEHRLRDAHGPSIEYFLSIGARPSDIDLLALRLDSNFRSLRIRVVETPPFIPAYVIDEKGLEAALCAEIQYSNPHALMHDLKSISAIMRLRRGEEYLYVENCRAVFATMNSALAMVSRAFLVPDATRTCVAPCITDYSLTNLLWLKQPTRAPDLPRKRIIADCFAATQPDERMWRNYLAEIDKLQRSGEVSPTDYYLLRYSYEARNALMEVTLGEEDAFVEGTVPEILELVKSRVQADVRAALEAERLKSEQSAREVETLRASAAEAARLAQASAETAAARERELQDGAERERKEIAEGFVWKEEIRRARIRQWSERAARIASRVVAGICLLLLGIGSAGTFPRNLPSFSAAPIRYPLAILQIVVFVFSLANLMFGATVIGLVRRFELWLAAFVERKMRMVFDV